MELNKISGDIVDSAICVHKKFGPGLLENVYEVALAHELSKRGYEVKRQSTLPVIVDDIKLDVGFRIDLLINDQVVIEAKAVETLHPVHFAQTLTYLRLLNLQLGLLINFNTTLLKDGIKRVVNNL